MNPIYFQSILQSSVVSKFHDKVSFWINEWKLPIDDQRELHQLVSDLLSKDGKEEVCTYMTITYYIISYLSYHTYHIISYHIKCVCLPTYSSSYKALLYLVKYLDTYTGQTYPADVQKLVQEAVLSAVRSPVYAYEDRSQLYETLAKQQFGASDLGTYT